MYTLYNFFNYLQNRFYPQTDKNASCVVFHLYFQINILVQNKLAIDAFRTFGSCENCFVKIWLKKIVLV